MRIRHRGSSQKIIDQGSGLAPINWPAAVRKPMDVSLQLRRPDRVSPMTPQMGDQAHDNRRCSQFELQAQTSEVGFLRSPRLWLGPRIAEDTHRWCRGLDAGSPLLQGPRVSPTPRTGRYQPCIWWRPSRIVCTSCRLLDSVQGIFPHIYPAKLSVIILPRSAEPGPSGRVSVDRAGRQGSGI